jgi:Fur family peroxide stress response transcriptional regulator
MDLQLRIFLTRPEAMTTPREAAPKRSRRAASSAERVCERVTAMLAEVRGSGLKLTPQRLAIVKELAADPTHPTAQELFERLRPAMPTMSFATVYNTLDALASAGLCAALSLSPGASRFDPNMQPHHHAVCDRCGLVRDVPLDGAASSGALDDASSDGPAPAELASAPGFHVRSVERIYRGLCARCAEAARAGSAHGRARPRAHAKS